MSAEGVRVHATALIDDDVELGAGTSVWDAAQIRRGAVVGRDCIIGGKAYLAGPCRVGDRVKINSFAYICAGVTIEDGVMVSAHATFTNDRYPRATTPDLAALRTSEVDEHTLPTLVKEGATIGAAAVIGPGLTIGRFAMVGMGSVVTRDVADFHLVVGNPATPVAALCRCGPPLTRLLDDNNASTTEVVCSECGRSYLVEARQVRERDD